MGLSKKEVKVIHGALWDIEWQAKTDGFAFANRALAMAKIEAVVQLHERAGGYTEEEFTELYQSFLMGIGGK